MIKSLPFPHSKYHQYYTMLHNLINKNDPCIVEIGAHSGADAYRFLHYFPKCNLYCFEPDERNINLFKNKIQNDRCKLFPLAVSDKTGTLTFNHIYHKEPCKNLPKKHSWITLEEHNSILGASNNSSSDIKLADYEYIVKKNIKCITLDEWDKEYNLECVDYLEIDVQGGEHNVLKGSKNFLKKVNYIKIEYGEERYSDYLSRDDTIQILNESNFEVITNISSNSKTGDLFFKKKIL